MNAFDWFTLGVLVFACLVALLVATVKENDHEYCGSFSFLPL